MYILLYIDPNYHIFSTNLNWEQKIKVSSHGPCDCRREGFRWFSGKTHRTSIPLLHRCCLWWFHVWLRHWYFRYFFFHFFLLLFFCNTIRRGRLRLSLINKTQPTPSSPAHFLLFTSTLWLLWVDIRGRSREGNVADIRPLLPRNYYMYRWHIYSKCFNRNR